MTSNSGLEEKVSAANVCKLCGSFMCVCGCVGGRHCVTRLDMPFSMHLGKSIRLSLFPFRLCNTHVCWHPYINPFVYVLLAMH